MKYQERSDNGSFDFGSDRELLSATPAVLLVGGLGTRLRPVVGSVPKPMAQVGKYSFLSLLVQQLRWQGIRQLVLCTGYLAEQIENEFADGGDWGVQITYSRESQPLGTAGALKLARRHLEGVEDFLVLNGDSFIEINFGKMLAFHARAGGIGTMAVCKVENAARYGTVRSDDSGLITGFDEKTGIAKAGWINAGVYVFRQEIFEHIPDGPASLERDVFPQILDKRVFALRTDGVFVDIGTPEDYAYAQSACDRLYQAALTAKS